MLNTIFNILAETLTQGNKRFMNSLFMKALFTVVNLLGRGVCQKFLTWVTTLEKCLAYIHKMYKNIHRRLVYHEENKKQPKGPSLRNNKINVIYLYSKL